MLDLITTIFYQPFLNVLILIYSLLGKIIETPDMGIAVIVFTVVIRILLFPLSMASTDSEHERHRIGKQYEKLKADLSTRDPLKFKKEKQSLINAHRGTVRFEMINIGIQLAIAIILWVIFDKGLSGEHDYLIYSWMPDIHSPYNLMFLGRIDLTEPNFSFNVLNTALLFIFETLELSFSPFPASSKDRIIQFALPIIAFFYFNGMPAGKKLFVISTLAISVILILVKETSGAIRAVATPAKARR